MGIPALASLVLASTLATSARADEADVPEPNPLSNRVNLPLENIFQFGVGPSETLKYTLKIKSVFPMRLWDDWHLFHRPIVQIEAAPAPKPGESGAFGLGDLEYQLYVSPPSTRDFIWGVGPDLWFPTATATALGSGKWSAGLAGAMRFTTGPWMFGVITTQYWSYGGDPDRSSVSQMTVQPHVVFHFPDGWYLGSSPILKVNWKASSGQMWTVPVGGGGGKEFELADKQKFQLQLQGFYDVVRPDFDARWELRFTVQWIFGRGA